MVKSSKEGREETPTLESKRKGKKRKKGKNKIK